MLHEKGLQEDDTHGFCSYLKLLVHGIPDYPCVCNWLYLGFVTRWPLVSLSEVSMITLIFFGTSLVMFFMGMGLHWILSSGTRQQLKRYRNYYRQQQRLEWQRRQLERHGPE
jgi:hypothetical protein